MSTFRPRELNWLGPGKVIRLGRGAIEIADPLAYFSDGPTDESAAVDLRLPIARDAEAPVGRELSFWPAYPGLTANQRRIYLDWLSTGRTAAPPEAGYAFLFFYGLERRALVDRRDLESIFGEILRLRELLTAALPVQAGSFNSHSLSLLWCMLGREPTTLSDPYFDSALAAVKTWSPPWMMSALSCLARAKRPLPASLAFAIAAGRSESRQSVVTKRVGPQFRELFDRRYRELYHDGLPLHEQPRPSTQSYRPASRALPLIRCPGIEPHDAIPDDYVLSDLWNSCVADLKKLSAVVAAGSGGPLTIAAWNALPDELRDTVEHPLSDALVPFIVPHTTTGGLTIATARELAGLAGVPPQVKLSAAVSRSVVTTLADVNYRVEPDARATGRSYRAEEPLVLFLNLGDDGVRPAVYAVASTLLNVGLALANADGSIDEREVAVLGEHIESALELNEFEQRRLSMLRGLRLLHPVTLFEAIKPLKKLPPVARQRAAKLSLAMVSADGVITVAERDAVRRLYTALGLDRRTADAALAALSSDPEAPVSVAPAVEPQPGEPIPPPPLTLRLNRAAIDSILKDTSDVAAMLAAAMHVEPEPPPPSKVQPPAASPGLPPRFSVFHQSIVSQPSWSRDELSALAKQQGLMLAGAVDAINDWSTEHHGGPLMYEDGDTFTLEPAYLQ